MYVFQYSPAWADLIVTLLSARHKTRNPDNWSYVCLCISDKFDAVLERHYLRVHEILGPYLHVFSLVPPPGDYVAKRYQEIRNRPDENAREAKAVYESFLTRNEHQRLDLRQIEDERVMIRSDLRIAGLEAGQDADFLFFAFQESSSEIDINVVAAAIAPLPDNAKAEAYFKLFGSMAKIAEKHYRANHSVQEFVTDLQMRWIFKIDVTKAHDVLSYFKDFIGVFRGK